MHGLVTYDAENRITNVAGASYTYDGDGRRVKKDSGTLYWTGTGADALAESDLGGVVQREFVFFGGKRVARLDGTGASPTVHYYFSDHLGSASVVSDAQGATIEEESDYYPYGGERVVANLLPDQNYKFTGKERDTESGFDYFGARYYASSMGRFLTTDPKLASGQSAQPQSWNRYAYALNNPEHYIDPDGKEVVVFFRPPDPKKGSLGDFGHVFVFVRNDRTGRASFFDYYPDPGKSAIHTSVPNERIKAHAGLYIASTPEAEDRMLAKIDSFKKDDPPFHVNLWEVLVGAESDCVSTGERILEEGGMYSDARTPSELWYDLYGQFSGDKQLETNSLVKERMDPEMGKIYGAVPSGPDYSVEEPIGRHDGDIPRGPVIPK